MKYLFGNWKMYLTSEDALVLAQKLAATKEMPSLTTCIFPNTLVFRDVANILADSPIDVGAQNVAYTSFGAYTGAVSAELFKQSGAAYALVGHSERRYIFGEDDAAVRQKIEACLEVGVTPVVCVGDKQEDVDEDKSAYRVKKQLMKAFEGLSQEANGTFLVAYEPVWAISRFGKGQPCDPAKASEMHALIKEELAAYGFTDIPVLYGGSATAENMDGYLARPAIDGILVGSASTTIESFGAMIDYCQNSEL